MKNPEQPQLGDRLTRALKSAMGWIGTFLVLAAVLVLLGKGSGFLGQVSQAVIALCVGGIILVFIIVSVAYFLVRRHNRPYENVSDPSPSLARTRSAEQTLSQVLNWMDEHHDLRLDRGNMVLKDRTRLSAAELAQFSDPMDQLAFIWYIRPSQPDDFLRSPQYLDLPVRIKDAVILLDFRRELMLHGQDAYLVPSYGFYSHDLAETIDAALRTGNTDLFDQLRFLRKALETETPPDMTGTLLYLIDDERTWARFLNEPSENTQS